MNQQLKRSSISLSVRQKKPASSIRILLADDSPDVLPSIKRILEPEFEVVGTVDNGFSLLAAANKLRPDVLIVDVMMPGISGVEAVSRLKKIPGLGAVAIILSVLDDPALVSKARSIGAMGVVMKASADRDLPDAIHSALAGHFYDSSSNRR